jgi:alpha-tubulin suppressor-like RCC1 family protein
MVNLNIVLTVIIISIILIILILLTLNYFNKIENFRELPGKYGYVCNYDIECDEGENRLCVTEEGYTAYSCGNNKSGEIGLYKNDSGFDVTIPNEMFIRERISISNIDIKDINVGESFSIILTNDDKIYIAGYTPHISYPSVTNDFFSKFRQFPINITNIKKIYTGLQHYILLTEDGKVYVCGYAYALRTGTGSSTEVVPTRILVPPTRDISVSPTHTLYLTEDGEVYGHGQSQSFANVAESRLPLLIPSSSFGNKKIDKICAGFGYSIFITEDNIFYYYGNAASLGWSSVDSYTLFPSSSLDGKKINKISPSTYHCLFLTEDGNVYGIGRNKEGQLGLGHKTNKNTITITPAFDMKDIFAGHFYSIFLDNDGNFFACGTGDIGLDADGQSKDVLSVTRSLLMPEKIKNIYTSIAVGSTTLSEPSMFLLTEDGDYYAYGKNQQGQLGLERYNNLEREPVVVEYVQKAFSLDNVTEISNYDDNTLLTTSDGDVYGCGKNDEGQLGCGRTGEVDGLIPISISLISETSLSNIKQICCNGRSTMILTEDGTVYISGTDYNKSLGFTGFMDMPNDRTLNYMQHPLGNVKKIATYAYNTFFILNDGSIHGFGWNSRALGFGANYGNIGFPTKLNFVGVNNVIDVAVGYNFSLFLMNDGTVYSCGSNNGAIGEDDANRYTPTIIPSLTDIVKIFAGYESSFFIDSEGYVYVCGNNSTNGLGSTGTTKTPTKITIPKDIIHISSSNTHTMFLKSDGKVYSCGTNYHGEIGNGTTSPVNVPTKIPITNVKSIATSSNRTVFLKNDNTVHVCGKNTDGSLGLGLDNSIDIKKMAEQIPITDVKAIAAYGNHNLIVMNDDTLYGWGNNTYGQLGLGNITGADWRTKNVPTLIDFFHIHSKFTNIHKVSAGQKESYFLKRDGTIYRTGQIFPELLPLPDNIKVQDMCMSTTGTVTSIGSYNEYFLITQDSEVYCWGSNSYGQLGLGDTMKRETPTLIEYDNLGKRFNNIKKIVKKKGSYSYYFLKNDGTVYACGQDEGNIPTKYPFMSNIKDISFQGIPMFLTNDGNVYVTENSYRASGSRDAEGPTKLNMKNIIAISSAPYGKNMVLTKYNDVYVWGPNTNGQLGLGDTVNAVRYTPTHNPYLSNVKKIFSGGGNSFASFFLLNKEG